MNWNKKAVGATLALGLAVSVSLPAYAGSATYVEQGRVGTPINLLDETKGKIATANVLVKVKSGKKASNIALKHGVRLGEQLGTGDWYVLEVPSGRLSQTLVKLKRDKELEAVEVDQQVGITGEEQAGIMLTPNDPAFSTQPYLNLIQAPAAWDVTTGSSSRTIAIIDTGVDLDHPDLIGKILPGYDFVNGDSIADDDNGHGTAVAGVAAASSNNLTDITGVDWQAKILPVKVLNASGAGTYSNVIQGIYYAANNGANVINMSFGGGASVSLQDAINYAYSKGCIIVAADDSYGGTVMYPAAYANVVGVTGLNASGVPTSAGSHIDIAAPATMIRTTQMGGGTAIYSGVSYSAAIVSGVMSLAWSCNLSYTNSVVQNRVLTQVDPIPGKPFGRVNAYQTVFGF
ncbi:hypothetical protein CIG75_04325 [Tumebacillus algifaecis]|uniref:Peptidase S8/S53 domain-containing protein n=1 Tax=Tumebacillus algifaecis TaxID=1214604 RepID=A0A223CYY3_9BACL|nr:S8 family serine peptidase [Tumebacillus algifaecis]ASS74287.1 hypothetical protein CIG75_04325 [Tumebacillus algifaecis]